ncbi:hypothetical protein [Sulfuricurvum sp.]|uniref:hypothetical protein n=1 Tax=Sulfuricurvum sp. TaxID=2025608 RepID=UPI003568053C
MGIYLSKRWFDKSVLCFGEGVKENNISNDVAFRIIIRYNFNNTYKGETMKSHTMPISQPITDNRIASLSLLLLNLL